MFPAQLDHPVRTLLSALTHLIALIDWCSWFSFYEFMFVVGKFDPTVLGTAPALCFRGAVVALTADRRVCWDVDARACYVVPDVDKVLGRSLQVHVVDDRDRSFILTFGVELLLPGFELFLDQGFEDIGQRLGLGFFPLGGPLLLGKLY